MFSFKDADGRVKQMPGYERTVLALGLPAGMERPAYVNNDNYEVAFHDAMRRSNAAHESTDAGPHQLASNAQGFAAKMASRLDGPHAGKLQKLHEALDRHHKELAELLSGD